MKPTKTVETVRHYDTRRHLMSMSSRTDHGMPLCHYLQRELDGPETWSQAKTDKAGALPVTRKRADVTCEKCQVHLKFSAACAGCEKPFPLRPDGDWKVSDVARLEIVPEVKGVIERARALRVFVCGIPSREYGSNEHHSQKPRLECERKAREKIGACPGCGDRPEHAGNKGGAFDTRTMPGTLCSDCYARLRRAREVEAQVKTGLKRYVIPARVVVPHLWGREESQDPDWSVARLLARIANGIGKKTGQDGKGERLLFEKGHREAGAEGPSVELTPDQVEALRELGRGIHSAMEAVYQKGIEEGRSLLFSLSRGEITIDQLQDRTVQQSKRRELEDDPKEEEDEEIADFEDDGD